jgi:PucR family transcriptional regulator, purine catabolism regulatory protein
VVVDQLGLNHHCGKNSFAIANSMSGSCKTGQMSPETGPPREILLADVLAMPVVRRGLPEVLVGARRLDRSVKWAHVIELPAPDRLLRGGELVLTTGLGIPTEGRGRRRWIADVAQQGAAALAIELGLTFQTRVPREIVAACRRHDLPLVAFRRRVAFVEITKAIHSAIVDYEGTMAAYADAVQERVVALLLDRRDLGSVVDAISEQLRVPLVLEGLDGEFIYCASRYHDQATAMRAFSDFRRYESRGGIDDGAVVATVDGCGSRLVALGIEAPLTDFERSALRRAARAIALDRVSEYYQHQLRAMSRGAFLTDLIAGRLTAADAESRAILLGFDPARGRLIPLAARRGASGGTEADEKWWSALVRPVRERAEGAGFHVILGVNGGTLLGLVAAADDDTIRSRLADIMHDVVTLHEATASPPVVVLGEATDGLLETGPALRRSAARAGAVRGLPPQPWHDSRSSDILDLLYGIRDTESLREFVENQLGPLLRDDSQRAAALLRTLEVFVEHGGRKASTARALHLDRASLYPRLRRIEELLHVDLEDPRVLLGLHAALDARTFIGAEPSRSLAWTGAHGGQ